MTDFIKVAKVSDIAPGTVKKIDVNGEQIAVANLNGQFFAINDLCTHKQCSLSGGSIDGQNIVCPCHGGQFDLKTGEAKTPPATTNTKTYEIKVENDEIWIKV